MRIEKLSTSIERMTEQEYAQALASQAKAIQDYNIMMGNIEDPAEEEGEENE